jgi:hypothetical protein
MIPAQDIFGDELIYHLVKGMEELTVNDINGFVVVLYCRPEEMLQGF